VIKLVIIAGPTAAGKSDAALKTALALNGEIINADSIQTYRHFDVGSGKPSREMRAMVPHHLVDILSPDEHFSFWDYNLAARQAISDVSSRGKLPIICGGTGLYIKAVMENLDGGVKGDEQLRAELVKLSKDELYARLKALDPATAKKIHPNDTYRVLRGVENAMLPLPKKIPQKKQIYDAEYFVLTAPKSVIYEKIGTRVEKMFEAGWIDEVGGILDLGFSVDCKPFKSVGYRQIVRHLAGDIPRENLAEEVKKSTRNYAKRQMTWFSAVKGAVTLDATAAPEKHIVSHLTGGK
jgi:tRNA dimethylallyltransferase